MTFETVGDIADNKLSVYQLHLYRRTTISTFRQDGLEAGQLNMEQDCQNTYQYITYTVHKRIDIKVES